MIQQLITTFDLLPDPLYDKAVDMAAELCEENHEYTCAEIFKMMSDKYRKRSWSNNQWIEHVNRMFRVLLAYDVLVYVNGFYVRK